MLHMLGAGLFIGVFYETYSRLRIKLNLWITLIQDLLFWVLTGSIVFLWLQYVNTGEMRLYIFLSLLCGFSMYRALFQAFYRKLLEGVIWVCIWSYRACQKTIRVLIILPLIWIYKGVLVLLSFLLGILAYIGRFFWKVLRFLFRPLGKLILQLWSKWRPSRDDSPTDQEREAKNEPLDSEGFFKRVANWLYKRKR